MRPYIFLKNQNPRKHISPISFYLLFRHIYATHNKSSGQSNNKSSPTLEFSTQMPKKPQQCTGERAQRSHVQLATRTAITVRWKAGMNALPSRKAEKPFIYNEHWEQPKAGMLFLMRAKFLRFFAQKIRGVNRIAGWLCFSKFYYHLKNETFPLRGYSKYFLNALIMAWQKNLAVLAL